MSDATRGDKLRVSLERRYGAARAGVIYAQMVGAAKGPFAAGNRLHDEHLAFAERAGVPPFTAKRKPRASLPGASPFELD